MNYFQDRTIAVAAAAEEKNNETEVHNLKLENKRLRMELEEMNRMQKELTVLNRDLQSRLVNDYEELRSMKPICNLHMYLLRTISNLI